MDKEWRTEYLLMGNTFQGICRALELAGRGSEVLLAVEETYLAADLCGRCLYRRDEAPAGFFPESCFAGDIMIPDRGKRYLEERCLEAGVRFYYGLYFIEETSDPCRILLAGKGGVISVSCAHVEWYQEEADLQDGISLRAWIKDKKDGSVGLLEVSLFENPKKRPEESCSVPGMAKGGVSAKKLLALRQELIDSFEQRRKQEPDLILGRFADRWGGSPVGEGTEEDRETADADVIVAGGGTAGAMAALYAARGGARTLLLEPLYDLGGASTLGGVNAYWFGSAFDDTREIDEKVDSLCQRCGIERPAGVFGKYDAFHGGIKGMVLLELCLQAGVEVQFGRLVYDVVEEDGRIVGVRTAGRGGAREYYGRLVIDATGDGDLAAMAGADMVYGAERDGFTFWGSLAQYTGPDSYQNNFSSMVRLDDQEDFTDFVITGRRRGNGDLFDHGSYVSVRESRHIRGRKVIGLKEVCLFATYEDGIYTCFSNYDPKGKLDADSVYCGYLVPQVRMQVPLDALLPVDAAGQLIQGLVVAGKAVSADHNAFPGLRMQRDLMHQGAVLGVLAAKAVRAGTDIDRLPREACRLWIKETTGDPLTLPCEKGFDSLREAAALVGKEQRSHWIDVPFTYEDKKVSPLLALVYGERKETLTAVAARIGAIEKEAGEARSKEGNKTEKTDREEWRETLLILKKIALFHGSDAYTKEIEDHILWQLSESGSSLPERKGSTMCAQLLPDHGVMPEVVYELNLLSHGKCFSMKPYEIVTDRLVTGDRDYKAIRKGIFTYIEAIAYAGEHSGREAFIPLLRRLTELPEFAAAFSEENKVALLAQRWQILWVILHRTLLLLGSGEGEKGLLQAIEKGGAAIRIGAQKALSEGKRKNGKDRTEKIKSR